MSSKVSSVYGRILYLCVTGQEKQCIIKHEQKCTLEMFKLGLFCIPVKGFDIRNVSVPMSTACSPLIDAKDNGKAIVNSKRMACEVFLGGSCNPTTWRKDIAIPTLQSLGITYYNPQVAHWYPELIAQEYEAKETARVLLFVIDEQTRNCAGIIEAAELAGSRPDSLVLVIRPYSQGQTILGETISNQEYCDLMNGLLVLQYLMDRQRIPIFESVTAALNCTSQIIRNAVNVRDLQCEDVISPSRISFNQCGTEVTKLKEAFKSLDKNNLGSITLTEALIILQSNGRCNVSATDLRNVINKIDSQEKSVIDTKMTSNGETIEQRVTFEQLCSIASEWSWRTRGNNGTIHCENWTNNVIADSERRDLYIGVVGKDVSWIENSAIPLVQSLGLTHYRPSTNEYNARVLPLELQRMKNSKVVVLNIGSHMRGVATMALAAHLIGLHAKLVLCVQSIPESNNLSGEMLTEQARKDYNRGRSYLSDMAAREGVPVFENIADALQNAIQIAQSHC